MTPEKVARQFRVGDERTVTGFVRTVEKIAPDGHLRVTLDFDAAGYDPERERLAKIEHLFSSYFIPDFGGYDWRGDAAVQEFARRLGRILGERSSRPGETQ